MTVKEDRESADQQRLALSEKVDDLIIRFDRLDDSVTGLVKAWEGATWLIAAIKWASTVGLAISALWWVLSHFGDKPS